MRYLVMSLLATAALGMGPVSGRFASDPNAYGPARWIHGQLSTGGPTGWFLARDTQYGPVVYAVDQPSGRKEPSYTHYRGPASAPTGIMSGQAATNGVLIGQMQDLAGHGPLLITDGSPTSDVEAQKVMEEVAKCPPNGPCPNRPDPEPEPEDEPAEPSPLEKYRQYALPAALFAAGCLIAYGVRRKRKGL